MKACNIVTRHSVILETSVQSPDINILDKDKIIGGDPNYQVPVADQAQFKEEANLCGTFLSRLRSRIRKDAHGL